MRASTRTWLSLGLSALVALTIVTLVATMLGVLLPSMDAEVERRNRARGQAVTGLVEFFLEATRSDLERLAMDISGHQKFDPDRLRQLLDQIVATDIDLQAIYVIDTSERVIEVGLPIERRWLRTDIVGTDFSARTFVQKARQSGQSSWSDTYLSQRGEIVVAVAVPLLLPQPDGVSVPGLLVGELGLEQVSDFTRRLARFGEALPIIVDRHGQIVGHPDAGRSLRQENISQLPLLRATEATGSSSGVFRQDDVDYLGTTVHMSALGWTALIGEPVDKALAMVDSTLRALAAASLLALGIALIAAFVVSRRISRRVVAFEHNMQAIAAGDYLAAVPRSSVAEIEGLSQSMGRMVTALLERESRLALAASVFESSVEGIAIIDARKRIISVNPALLAITGFEADELVGNSAHLIFGFAQHNRDFVRDVRASIKTKGSWRGELLGRRKSGEFFPLAVTMTAVCDERGVIAHYIGSLIDITERKRTEQEIQHQSAQIKAAFVSTVEMATTIGEMRDPYTAGHQRRVASIAVAVGRVLGGDEQQIEGLRIAGYLHDIGKITIPAEILSRPGRLSQVEFELIRGHAQASYDVLTKANFSWPVAEVVLQHHERMDGSGYPQGLKGEAILLEARILAVADVVEAMSSHRPYRVALGIEQALAEIERGSGTLYDPAVAEACLKLFREQGYQVPA